MTSSPTAWTRTLAMKSLTTGRDTSASTSAERTSARAASTSDSESAPRPRSPSNTSLNLFCKPSNIVLPFTRRVPPSVRFADTPDQVRGKLFPHEGGRQEYLRGPRAKQTRPQGAHLRCLGSIPSPARDRKGRAIPDGEGLGARV